MLSGILLKEIFQIFPQSATLGGSTQKLPTLPKIFRRIYEKLYLVEDSRKSDFNTIFELVKYPSLVFQGSTFSKIWDEVSVDNTTTVRYEMKQNFS